MVYLSLFFINICKTNLTNPMKDVLNTGASWLNENWLILALIVSEVAALLPTKAKGIIDAILKIGGAIFKKSSSKS